MQAVTEAPILARTDGYLQAPARGHRRPRARPARIWRKSMRRKLDQQIQQAEAADRAGPGRNRPGAGEPRAGQGEPRAGARDGRTLEDAGRTRDRSAAGRRSVQAQLAAQDANVQALGEGDSGAAKQSGGGQGESGPPAGGPGLSPRQGAVRRRDHAAQCGRRRARRHGQHAALPDRADRIPFGRTSTSRRPA